MRPNVLIIFTDDQGYGDLGLLWINKTSAHRESINWPKKERGLRASTPSTFAVLHDPPCLTGRYPIRSKGWGMPADEITFAELIRTVGYQTACIGKWDVSNRKPIIDRMPNAQGFDYYFGTLGANDGGRVSFHENNEPAGATDDMGSLTRLYTDKAIEFLKQGRDRKPTVRLVRRAYDDAHDHRRFDPFNGKSAGGLYGDVVEEFDYETGRLLDTIDELGLRENTLVIYTTDNGPWNQPAYTEKKKGHPPGSIFWGDAGPLRAGKGSCYEGVSRVAVHRSLAGQGAGGQRFRRRLRHGRPACRPWQTWPAMTSRTTERLTALTKAQLLIGVSEHGSRDDVLLPG